jgi:hypothetical protein
MVFREWVSTVGIVHDAQLHFTGKTLVFQTWQQVRAIATNELSRINAWWSNNFNRRPTWSFDIWILIQTELNYFTVWLQTDTTTTVLLFKHAYKQTHTCEQRLDCSGGIVTTVTNGQRTGVGFLTEVSYCSFSQGPGRLSDPHSFHVDAMKACGEVDV